MSVRGALVTLRPATAADVDAFAAIRRSPEVHARWGGDDIEDEIHEALADPELHVMAVELDGIVDRLVDLLLDVVVAPALAHGGRVADDGEGGNVRDGRRAQRDDVTAQLHRST